MCDEVFHWSVLDCSGRTHNTPALAYHHAWHTCAISNALFQHISNAVSQIWCIGWWDGLEEEAGPDMKYSRHEMMNPPPLNLLPQIPFCARSSCIKCLRFLLPPFSFFMSPEINLAIWIDSCVTWDYKTSYVLCGRSPLSTNLVVWVCVWMSLRMNLLGCYSSCNSTGMLTDPGPH